MIDHESESPQIDEATIFSLNAVVSQDKVIGLLFDSFVHTRATLEAMAQLQIRALSQVTDLLESDLEAEFQEIRQNYVVAYAKLLQERLAELASHHSDEQ